MVSVLNATQNQKLSPLKRLSSLPYVVCAFARDEIGTAVHCDHVGYRLPREDNSSTKHLPFFTGAITRNKTRRELPSKPEV